MKDEDGNELTDIQYIYYVCSFDKTIGGKEAYTGCGELIVAKTDHSEDPEKLCFANSFRFLFLLLVANL